MLRAIVYYSSYLYVLGIFCWLMLRPRSDLRIVIFLMVIALIPIGKLFYMPVPGLTSVDAAFIASSLLALGGLTFALISGVRGEVFLPFAFAIPPVMSLLFLSGAAQQRFLSPDVTTGSSEMVVLRLASIFLVTAFSCYCSYIIARKVDARVMLVRVFIIGTLFASFVGVVIFYGVFVGQLTEADLEPVSSGVHIIGGAIYRFNPGANVNEFGQVAGFALLLLPWAKLKLRWTIVIAMVLLVVQFLTLTRATWLALAVAYFVMAMFSSAKVRAIILSGAAIGVAGIVILALTWEPLTPLLESRTRLSGGVSGDDRLGSYAAAISGLLDEPLRLLFGFGWSANIYGQATGMGTNYIHSVPLMLLFDTGLVGIIFYTLLFGVILKLVYERMRDDLATPAALLAFMLFVSLLHHNFYHVQTWMIMGLILGSALAARPKLAPVAQLLPGVPVPQRP